MKNYVTVALAQYEKLRSEICYERLMERSGASRQQVHHDAKKLADVGAIRMVKGARGHPSRIYPLVPVSVFRALAESQESGAKQ